MSDCEMYSHKKKKKKHKHKHKKKMSQNDSSDEDDSKKKSRHQLRCEDDDGPRSRSHSGSRHESRHAARHSNTDINKDERDAHQSARSSPETSHNLSFQKDCLARYEEENCGSPQNSPSRRPGDAHRGSKRRRRSSDSSDSEDHRRHKRRRSPGGGEGGAAETLTQDYEFGWEQYRSVLSRIFFNEESAIKRGTKEYDDFWPFLKKYVAFQRKRAAQGAGASKQGCSSGAAGSKFDLPQNYDRRYRINISLPPQKTSSYIGESRDGGTAQLSEPRLAQFRQILLHYIDFLQKQKFAKLVKIRHDQHNLPIYQYKQKIIEAVRDYSVVVVAGDTGCGKSTQVPQYLLEAGFDCIACTQPRRIACISLSKRVAYETLNEYGSEVAYQVRFEKSRTRRTRIVFLTEGLLLRQISTDPQLSQYNVIVIDEVHERHIHTDFLLGVLKCMTLQRSNLKIVLMSATINIQMFSQYFENAPVLQVPGRLYPIQLEYVPICSEEKTSKSERLDPAPYLRILQLIDKKYPVTERGDILMFLSGLSEIMAVVEAASQYALATQRWIILPLHSALSVSEQDKVFDFPPEGVRKCIVSTNIAETSVTIDGVRFVVDSGKVKEMSFDSKCKMQRLQEFWISQASAEQRKGRAGRTGPGVCYRLYDEKDYNALQDYSTPEIQRVPLDSLILQMIAMGLPNARKFPFIEAPAASAIENSVAFLREQGALTEDEKLTPIGQMLSQLPVDVVVGKMLIMGAIFHMIDPVLSIAACLSVQSPFTARAHQDYDAMNARKPLESDHGDPFTLLNAFDEWVHVKASGQPSRKWCKRRGLEEQRFYEMTKLKKQFHQLLVDHGLLDTREDDDQRYLTSTERRQKHAEKRHLRDLKRDQQKQSVRRKVLKLNEGEYAVENPDDDDKPDLEADIRDLEFRLTHDLDQMQEKSNRSRSFTFRDISLLKIILCSGLYPQVAVADENNNFKPDSEQAFHTKSKPFVVLHPTSIFITASEALEMKDSDVVPNSTSDSRRVMSSKHQLVTYVSLLETTKPYLVNVMRVPALQTLLLYASSIDTNADCTRIICDSWFELEFMHSDDGEKVLSSVVQLRSTWLKLIQIKLDAKKAGEDGDATLSQQARRLERTLATKLTEFLASDIPYSLHRLLAAEISHLYKGQEEGDSGESGKFLEGLFKDAKPHPYKGGLQVNEYITFNCLSEHEEEYTTYLQKHWTCPVCEKHMIVTVVERLQHEQTCSHEDKQSGAGAAESKKQENDALAPLRKPYHCNVCQNDLMLTTTEILKHKRSCKPT